MIEFILFYLLSWPALAIILLLGVLAEHYDSPKMTVFLGIVAITISYAMFKVPLATLAIIAGAYLVFGVLWSFWRYTRFVRSGVKSIGAKYTLESTIKRQLHYLSPNENIGKIVRWVLVWPLSLAGSITGDIINLTHKLITQVFHRVYEKIFSKYTKDFTNSNFTNSSKVE